MEITPKIFSLSTLYKLKAVTEAMNNNQWVNWIKINQQFDFEHTQEVVVFWGKFGYIFI
jgi:hypothetical protein